MDIFLHLPVALIGAPEARLASVFVRRSAAKRRENPDTRTSLVRFGVRVYG